MDHYGNKKTFLLYGVIHRIFADYVFLYNLLNVD